MIYEQNPKIVVSREIKKELDEYKLVSSETYDSVITRMLDKVKRFDKKYRTKEE